MKKVLAWFVSSETKYFHHAMKILEQQHNGIEIVDSAAGEEIFNITPPRKNMTFCLSSARKKLAWAKSRRPPAN